MNEQILTRAAPFEPATFDAEKRTVQVVFSTGADVMRSDWEGLYLERLSMDAAAVDLSKLIGGPVLDNHDRFSGVRSILGVVEAANVDGKRGLADIRFSERPEVQGVIADVGSGVIRSVSAGYQVQKWDTFKRADGTRIKTATRWTPVEVSFTPLAADAGAQTRGKTMIETLQTQIRSLVELSGLPATFGEDLVTRNVATIEEARTAVFTEAARRTPVIQHQAPATVTREAAPEETLRAMGEALYTRADSAAKPSEQARPWVGRRVADLARELLRVRGLSTFGGDAEVITRSLNTTSDFSLLLSNLANKTLQARYQAAPSGIKSVCRRSTVNDFKSKFLLRRGEMPTLQKVTEKGEFTRGKMLEGREGYKIDTFGRIFGINRQALINDDLGAFTDVAADWGLSAAEFENSFLVDLLASNSGAGPKLMDSKALFHVDRGNLAATGGAISDTTLSAARLALRGMKGLDGTTPINATARYLTVPAALETVAERWLATIAPAQAANVNPFSGKLDLVVDPRLDAKSVTGWYLFADPAVLPVIEYSYLSGYEGVQVETRNGFDVDGVEVKARLDFGAGGIDSRGAYRNAGN
jgi:hypothetical protein